MALAMASVLGLASPALATTEASALLDRFEIVEQMHDHGYATVLGIERYGNVIRVETVDLEGLLTVVLNPSSGQVIQAYRSTVLDTTTAQTAVESPVMELSTQRTTPPLQTITLDVTRRPVEQGKWEAETILPLEGIYGSARTPYVEFRLAQF